MIARRYPPLSNAPTVEVRFARDSLLEGDGFELSVPRQRLHPSATANHLSSHRLPRKLGLRVASDWDGPSFASCRNAGVVARAFPMSRRHDALSFTHHAEVASLKPVGELLRWAEEPIAETGKPHPVLVPKI